MILAQAFKPRTDEHRNEDERRNEHERREDAARPNIASNPRTVTTPREPNPTDAFSGTFSPTKARGTGSADAGPTEDEIRRRAYEIYQSRGAEPGREQEDWAQAERELRQKRKAIR